MSDWLASYSVLLWSSLTVGSALFEAVRPVGSGGRALWVLALGFGGNYLLWNYAEQRAQDNLKVYGAMATNAGDAMFLFFLGAIPCLFGFAFWRLSKRGGLSGETTDVEVPDKGSPGPQAAVGSESDSSGGCALAVALVMVVIVASIFLFAGPPGAR